jgi:hypothetical protein
MVATKGATPIGNYLLLLYILEIFEDDYKRNEEKKSQTKTAPLKQESETTDATTITTVSNIETEISTKKTKKKKDSLICHNHNFYWINWRLYQE